MNRLTRVVLAASAAMALAAPVAAQDRHHHDDDDWSRELSARIDAAIARVTPQIEAMLKDVTPRIEAAARAAAAAVDGQFGPPGPPRPNPRPGPRGRTREERRGPAVTESFSRTVRLGRNGSFDLSNVAGDITITGNNGEEVRIEAIKEVRGESDADARELLRAIDIQVSERSGSVEVRTDLPRRRNFSGSVDFTINLPTGTDVAVHTVSGDVKITNVKGELRAESISGDVTASTVGRVRLAKSVSGDVRITDGEGDEVSGGTVSGDVEVRNVKARAMDLESISGDIRLTDVDSERVNLKSISGDLDYRGRLARNGRYELQSHSGGITVTPSANTGFDLDATTFSGDVRSDYGITLRGTSNSLVGRGRNRTVRGSFGDASAILSLRSFSGDIVIVKR